MLRRPTVGGHCRDVAGVVPIGTALAPESGRNRFNHGFEICNPGRPFFSPAGNRNEFFNV